MAGFYFRMIKREYVMKKFSDLPYKTQILIAVPGYVFVGAALGVGLVMGSIRYCEKKYQNNKSGTQSVGTPLLKDSPDSLQTTYKYDGFMYNFQKQKER